MSDEINKIKRMCDKIIALVDFYQRTVNLPSCNDCKKEQYCEYSYGWGGRVRWDCPLHEPIEEGEEK